MTQEARKALTRVIHVQIDHSNYGIFSHEKTSFNDALLLNREKITFDMNKNRIYQDGKEIYMIVRRYAEKKQQGMYKELIPELRSVEI